MKSNFGTTCSTIQFDDCDLIIVTENASNEIYIIRSKYIQDLLDDWQGECKFVPENDARVFFASWNCQPINPYNYHDFSSLCQLLKRKTI